MDLVPLKKPYTLEEFKRKTDLYLQGMFGTSDKQFYIDKITEEYDKAKDAGLDTKAGIEFIKERNKMYKTLADEGRMQGEPTILGPSYGSTREEFSDGTEPKTSKVKTDVYKYPINTGGGLRYSKVKGTNQYGPMRSLEELQKIIDDAPMIRKGKGKNSKLVEMTPKDLTGRSEYNDVKKGGTQYITRKELDEYKDKLNFKTKGKPVLADKRQSNITRRDITKLRSSPSLETKLSAPKPSGKNFHHAGFKQSLVDLKNTMYIPGSPNRRMTKLFEDPLLKEMENFTKVFDDPGATTKEKQKAATIYLKNDRALRQKYPEFKNFKTRLSFRRTALDPSGIMFKEKLPDPSLAISQEPGMTLKGEKPSSPKGKQILRLAAEKFGDFAKPISKVALRAVAPFIPVVGTAGMVMGGADVAKAAEQGLRNEELGIAYLAGPEVAQNYANLKQRIKGKEDDTETFVP